MIAAYISLSFILIVSYGITLLYILKQWNHQSTIQRTDISLIPPFSIIIPVRNEESTIGPCLDSILSNHRLEEMSFEIFVVDDHSTDNTLHVVEYYKEPRIKVLKLEDHLDRTSLNSFKKEAIHLALKKATGKYCIQIDGDVVIGSNHLISTLQHAESNSLDFLAAPVMFKPGVGLLHHFQVLDITGMMALTQAGIRSGKWYLANGANMIYKNEDIVTSQNHLASGDDVHRVEAIAKKNDAKIAFLKNQDAIVHTSSLSSTRQLYNQRLRWGTKNKSNKNLLLKAIMVSTYLNALMMPIHIVMFIILGPIGLVSLVVHLFFKISLDYIYLEQLSSFFKVKESLKYFISVSFVHLAYIIVVGTASMFVKKYEWKGRLVE